MKYWRGYLVAAILAAFTWGFREIAATHTKLVDMIYPYITRLVQNFMTGWSSGVDFCVWQAILLALVVAAFASIVLMIIFRWNPIQWFGWILAVASLILLLHTGIYGMNAYAGDLADDIRLMKADCSQEQMEQAAIYYRDMANELAEEVDRNSDGSAKALSLDRLNQDAVSGFHNLVYKKYYSVFAGTTLPVKALDMADFFTSKGHMGVTVPITGEAAVNLQAPGVMLPFAVSREMCYRMSIASEADKHFGAFLACQASDSEAFRYSGYVMAYYYCLEALADSRASTVAAQASSSVRKDVQAWEAFIAPFDESKTMENQIAEVMKTQPETNSPMEIARLLVRWHQQEIVIPSITEPEIEFDPMDETQVDLTGLPHGPKPTEPTEAAA